MDAMLDVNVLLLPVSDARPAGDDLSFSPEYDLIQESRRADDPSLEQGAWVTELKAADWPAVARQCGQLLSGRSKDLRLAAWWAEAQVRNHGIPGLTAGYQLLARLCEEYWDDLHPAIDDGDLEQRIGNVAWLITHSTEWLRQVPLTSSPQGRFGLADFEASRARTDADNPDAPSTELLDRARRETSREFYLELSGAMPACHEALAMLEQVVERRLGSDGPSFTALRDQLARFDDTVQRFAREAGVLVDVVDATTGSEDSGPAIRDVRAGTACTGEISSRTDAIEQLRKVARYFRSTEPHSPVAYLADKAAHWGEMPLHVWLKRVIGDEAVLGRIEELLDIANTDRAEADHS